MLTFRASHLKTERNTKGSPWSPPWWGQAGPNTRKPSGRGSGLCLVGSKKAVSTGSGTTCVGDGGEGESSLGAQACMAAMWHERKPFSADFAGHSLQTVTPNDPVAGTQGAYKACWGQAANRSPVAWRAARLMRQKCGGETQWAPTPHASDCTCRAPTRYISGGSSSDWGGHRNGKRAVAQH